MYAFSTRLFVFVICYKCDCIYGTRRVSESELLDWYMLRAVLCSSERRQVPFPRLCSVINFTKIQNYYTVINFRTWRRVLWQSIQDSLEISTAVLSTFCWAETSSYVLWRKVLIERIWTFDCGSFLQFTYLLTHENFLWVRHFLEQPSSCSVIGTCNTFRTMSRAIEALFDLNIFLLQCVFQTLTDSVQFLPVYPITLKSVSKVLYRENQRDRKEVGIRKIVQTHIRTCMYTYNIICSTYILHAYIHTYIYIYIIHTYV
jgi:hypothetical protein